MFKNNTITESNPFGICDIEVLIQLENDIGFKLPKEYRDYILQYNGADFKNEWFNSPKELLGKKIHGSYAVTNDSNLPLLREMLPLYKKKYLLIFSDDGMGKVLISLRGRNKGHIYYKDWKVRLLSGGLLLLANSFNEFIDSLVNKEEFKRILKETDPEDYNLLYGEE